MTVKTREEAWKAVNEMFPSDYDKDEVRSQNAGYSVYKSRINNDSIIDLSSRLEMTINNKTVNIWIVEENIEETASEIAETVAVDRCGIDYSRAAEEKEKNVIYKIAVKALKKIKKLKKSESKQDIYNKAESTLKEKLSYLNAQKTLLPLKTEMSIEQNFDDEIEKIAEKISDYITLRSETGYIKLKARKAEKNIIFQIALKALRMIKANEDSEALQYICDFSEIKLNRKIEQCNGYETIYLPLKEIIAEWKSKTCCSF